MWGGGVNYLGFFLRYFYKGRGNYYQSVAMVIYYLLKMWRAFGEPGFLLIPVLAGRNTDIFS